MIIDKVELVNFRSHQKYRLVCKDKTSLIVGENGFGKTSVLEAICIALQGKSFRAVDGEILKRGEEFYRIELKYVNGEKVVVTFDGLKKNFLVGDKKYLRLPKKYRYPVVLFVPDDLHLMKASPTTKREYFDRILGQIDDVYASELSKYNKALKQRNELLKAEYLTSDSLFSWNILLAKYGRDLRRKRQELMDAINGRLTEIYRSIAENKDVVWVEYELYGEELTESSFLARLESDFERDRIMGHTNYGVHRDNYNFIFNEKMANGSASRGEVRSIILALKFIEAEIVVQRMGKKPVVLLDDVFSELDMGRQRCLVQNFKDNQVIITSVEGVD